MKNAIKNAVVAANALYIAREGANAKLNKAGINPSLSTALDVVEKFTDAQCEAIKNLGIESRLIDHIKSASNVKKPVRTLQALAFIVTGNGAFLQASARTFLLEYCGLVTGEVKTRDALAFVATGKGNDMTSDRVKVSQARKIRTAFGAVSVSSEQTQNSVSFSKGGIGEALGLTEKEKRNGLPNVHKTENNPVALALDSIIKTMTDGKLALIVAQSTGK